MGQVLSNLISIVFGRKQRVETSDEENVYHALDDHHEEVKPIHPTSGYGKTRVSEEDEGSVVIIITDADQVREDAAEPFSLVSGDPETRLSEDERVITIIVGNGVEAVEKIKPVTDDEVRVDAEPFPLLFVDPKTRVSEDERAREDVDPYLLVSGDPNTRVSEDEWVTIIFNGGVEAVEKTKPATDAEVRVDAEPFPLLSVDPKTRVSEYERAREDLEPFLLFSVDPKPRVSEDEKVREDVADPFPLISGDPEIIVPKDGSGAKRRKRKAKRKERRIKHYYSSHKILLVGEGDFSFSACLAKVFGSANNMVATSLNSKGFLEQNYSNVISNINGLKSKGCMVLHGVDATNMSGHQLLKGMKFDRIIFNFPYAGFFKNEPRVSQMSRHQKLVTLFFKNAKKMLSEEGEIHISHKSNGFHCEWNIVSLASLSGLNFIKDVKFNLNDYPGYNTKRGFGGDENFECNPSETYMFGL